GIPHRLMQGKWSLREDPLILFGHFKWVVRGKRKETCKERLWHLGQLIRHELHKRFIPDSPNAIKILIIAVFVFSKIMLYTCQLRISRKPHTSIWCSMEKSCLITFITQELRYACGLITRIDRKHKRLSYRRYSRNDRR